jgi:hypothetical protein
MQYFCLVDQGLQVAEFWIVVKHLPDISQHTGNILKVLLLAIPKFEPVKDAHTFKVPLQTRPVEPSKHGVFIHLWFKQAGLNELGTELPDLPFYPIICIIQVAVTQERDQVIGDRAKHGSLEVYDAGGSILENQEVSAMKVSMNKGFGNRIHPLDEGGGEILKFSR